MSALSLMKSAFEAVDRPLDRIFGRQLNPFRYLGALGFYFLWVAFVSGVYVYIFFDTSVVGAYLSLETLQREQWWLGGVMRSLHRYGSDGLVLFMALHMLREIAFDRYRGARWFSWVTGTPVLWLVIVSGITGYWLVWDERAQYVAIVSAEWLDQLAVFGGVISRNFLGPGSLGNRFFSLLMFIHIALPLFLLFGLWLHLQRMSRSRIHPPKYLTYGFSAAMIGLSLYKPALSQAPADLGKVPDMVEIDWFYLAFYPLFDGEWAAAVWPVATVLTLLLIIFPWLPPLRKRNVAEVFLDHCNGCQRCVDDCPYNAVSMLPRTDGRPFEEEAVMRPDLCVACGICVGSCPSSTPFRRTSGLVTGIDLPEPSLSDLRASTNAAGDQLSGQDSIIVFRCQNAASKRLTGLENVGVVELPCIGMLPPPFIDYVLSRDLAQGVYLESCAGGDCRNRFGVDWTAARVAGTRDPYLRKRVPRARLAMGWDEDYLQSLATRLQDFRGRLKALDEAPEGDAE